MQYTSVAIGSLNPLEPSVSVSNYHKEHVIHLSLRYIHIHIHTKLLLEIRMYVCMYICNVNRATFM